MMRGNDFNGKERDTDLYVNLKTRYVKKSIKFMVFSP